MNSLLTSTRDRLVIESPMQAVSIVPLKDGMVATASCPPVDRVERVHVDFLF